MAGPAVVRTLRLLAGPGVACWLAACSLPGQVYPVYGYDVIEEDAPVSEAVSLTRIAPDLLLELAERDLRVPYPNPELQEAIRGYRYRIGPQDILSFTVWDHPEITIPAGQFRDPELQGHVVDASGRIFFPYVGEVDVTGRSLEDIRREITASLAEVIQDPQLDLRVVSFRSKKVHVTGQVAAPGVLPITDSPLTLIEALTATGGARPEAALQQVQVLRNGQTLTFDVQALFDNGDMRQNTLLQDGDVVHVPENSLYRVHVLGEVEEPGSVQMPSGRLNLAEVITETGGLDRTNANPERIFVFRGSFEEPNVYWLDARSPDAMLMATQFRMQPQDVVFVASSELARFNRAISLILPTVQTLWQTQTFIDRLQDD